MVVLYVIVAPVPGKSCNTDINEEDQDTSFLSYTSQSSLVILQFLQCLPSVQHHLPSLLPCFPMLPVNKSCKREQDKIIT